MPSRFGDDYSAGNSGNDALHGGGGNDHLSGGLGNDFLFGELGRDYLEGCFGDDVYCYNKGDGQDTIREIGGNDTLLLQDAHFAELLLTRADGALHISFAANADDGITVAGWDAWFGSGKVETVQLADVKLNAKQLEYYADGRLHTAAELQRDFGIEIM